MRVQHFKAGSIYAGGHVCSGSHVHALDGVTRDSLAACIIKKCRGQQAFMLVSPQQYEVNKAINGLARKKYRHNGEYKFTVRRLGTWAPGNEDSDAKMVIVSAQYV